MNSDFIKKSESNSFLARHITIDYYDCDVDILHDNKILEEALGKAVKAIGATIVSSHFSTFEPYGVSGVIVLAESHFTIHTWPEYGYAAIDMFTCGNMFFEKGIDLLKDILKSQKVNLVTDLNRGINLKKIDNNKNNIINNNK